MGHTHLEWAATIAGALGVCFTMYPPPIRREQFILNLRHPPASWVSRWASSQQEAWITNFAFATQGMVRPTEAQYIALPPTQEYGEEEARERLWYAMFFALQNPLPMKVTVQFHPELQRKPYERVPRDNIGLTLADFALRLLARLIYVQQYRDYRPRGSSSRHPTLTWAVGLASAVTYRIVMHEQNREAFSSDFKPIWDEALQTGIFGERLPNLNASELRRGLVIYIGGRALQGANGLEEIESIALIMNGGWDLAKLHVFDTTYIQPYTSKLKPHLPRFEKALRHILLGHPGALAEVLEWRPKSTV